GYAWVRSAGRVRRARGAVMSSEVAADRGPWEAPDPTGPPADSLVHAIERSEALDGPAGALANVIKKVVPPGALKNGLSGTWLGHPLHPLLTDVVIGAWTSAMLLDLTGGADAEGGADR